MSGIKFELQKQLFQASKERLHEVITVTSLGRKKKTPCYLCVTGSIGRPIRFSIYLVKKTDKNYKRKNEWPLVSLKEANFKGPDTVEFELQLEKNYQWVAGTIEEKKALFSLLYQICSRMHRGPKLVNYQAEELVGDGHMGIAAVQKDGNEADTDDEDFGLTDREEADLEKVLVRAENAVVNADAFMEQLARELSILDGENIHSIMESESQVNALMDSIDASILVIEKVEAELQEYEDTVIQVKNAVEKIEHENSQMGIAARNQQILYKELSNLIETLDFPTDPAAGLITNPDFSNLQGIQKTTEAVYKLKDALAAEENIHPALHRMQAVVDQKRRLEKYKAKFSQSLTSHLVKLLVHYGNYSSLDSTPLIQAFRLPPLTHMHKEIIPYEPLSGWLKAVDSKNFDTLAKTYMSCIQKIYEKNVKALFDEARNRISGTSASSKISGSTGDLRIRGRYFGKTRILANREGGDTESQGSGEGSVDSNERQHFYDVLEQLLEGLEPAVNSEEQFVSQFLHLVDSVPSVTVISPSKNQGGAEVRKVMTGLCGSVEGELVSFLAHYEKLEASFCMGAMVRLGNHILKPENTSTYIGMIFGSVLVQEKRSFDRLMNSYVQYINDSRLPRKAKPGIIAFVTDFEDFALMAETIFSNSSRRSDLEKWYVRMLGAIFDGIVRLSNEGGKTPAEVIRMENFHRLHAILSQLKVAGLDVHKREAKTKYNESLNAYVTKYFGRPLIKLNEFFEGVQGRVSQGVKESEIGYQMAFSKTELKKVIKEYPGKEVKKGLEALYKKVDKHLSEEENLLQVVWRAMQEEFIVQYKSIESLISRCYPGAKISLEFSIDDILNYFSDIAQSH